jgi:hypothetical protein
MVKKGEKWKTSGEKWRLGALSLGEIIQWIHQFSWSKMVLQDEIWVCGNIWNAARASRCISGTLHAGLRMSFQPNQNLLLGSAVLFVNGCV